MLKWSPIRRRCKLLASGYAPERQLNHRDDPFPADVFVARLRKLTGDIRRASFERGWTMMEREHWPKRDDGERPFQRTTLKERLVEAVEEIDALLPDDAIDEEIIGEFEDGDWSIGTEFEVLAPRNILRGFLVPIREVPTRVLVTMKVFAFLTINGSKDLLDRHLDQGIHYHYALSDKTHTTTMICWDTRWIRPPRLPKVPPAAHPLFHELHAQGAKHATARPNRWGDEKRKSIWAACLPDLSRWRINEFRCASNGSSPVWPLGVALTPRPAGPARGRTIGKRKK